MRKINLLRNILSLLTGIAIVISVVSCIEDNDGNPDQNAGNLSVEGIDPPAAEAGELITLTGSGLGDIRSIVFDKNGTSAIVLPTMNTSGAMVFNAPDTVQAGIQNMVITNGAGNSVTIPYQILGFPKINEATNYNFVAGDELTLIGKNLDDVTSIVFTGTTEEIEIVSQTPKQLVITMPATNITIKSLDITNATGLSTTTQKFVNLDKAFAMFTDQYDNGFETGSWGGDAVASTEEFKTGTASVAKTYLKGNWHVFGIANWGTGVPNDGYNYLAFWIKGAAIDHTLYLTGDLRAGGFGNADQSTPIDVPANVWSYYLIPMSVAKLWETNPTGNFKQVGFWIKGPDNQDETFYIDDWILIK